MSNGNLASRQALVLVSGDTLVAAVMAGWLCAPVDYCG
jgi:hypothetical protein